MNNRIKNRKIILETVLNNKIKFKVKIILICFHNKHVEIERDLQAEGKFKLNQSNKMKNVKINLINIKILIRKSKYRRIVIKDNNLKLLLFHPKKTIIKTRMLKLKKILK